MPASFQPKFLISLALLLSLILAPLAWSADKAQPPKYPVPKHLSDHAQAILNRPIDLQRTTVVPKGRDQWLAAVEQSSAQYRPMLEAALAQAVRIEKTTMAGVTVRIITPDDLPKEREDKILLNLHGGAYVYFGGDLSVLEGVRYAVDGQYRVIAVDYRMPPDHPFPAAIDDAVAVYRELLKSYKPEHIAMFGGSAGGGLTASTVLHARDLGLPLPAAAVMNTPWSDLSKTGDSYYSNEGVDPILPSYDGVLAASAKLYAGEYDLKHPLISPVYADYRKGFPPSLLISGTRDLLLSATVRLHLKLRESGIAADLLVFDALWHGFTADPRMPEAQMAMAEVMKFLDTVFSTKRPSERQ